MLASQQVTSFTLIYDKAFFPFFSGEKDLSLRKQTTFRDATNGFPAFPEETVGGVAKYRLFSQASEGPPDCRLAS